MVPGHRSILVCSMWLLFHWTFVHRKHECITYVSHAATRIHHLSSDHTTECIEQPRPLHMRHICPNCFKESRDLNLFGWRTCFAVFEANDEGPAMGWEVVLGATLKIYDFLVGSHDDSGHANIMLCRCALVVHSYNIILAYGSSASVRPHITYTHRTGHSIRR